MLRELRIRNYAVIEDLDVRLEPGLNVLSGETGAGKSIIVGALSLLLGERATSDVIRAGETRAAVEGAFDLGGRPDLRRICEERAIEVEHGLLVMKREVNAEGPNRAWINGSPATAGVVGAIGRALVDLHGQHEHQTLLRAEEQRAILDAYAGAEAAAAEVRETHGALRAARRQVDEIEAERARVRERSELLRHQAEEIEAAKVRPDEDRELEEMERRLGHSEELTALSSELHDAIYARDDSVVARLAALRRRLDAFQRIDPTAAEMREALESALYTLQDLGERLAEYRDDVDHDPARLEQVRRRQDLLYRLRSKYGPTLADVIEAGRRARAELAGADEADFKLGELRARAAELESRLAAQAGRLSEARRRAAAALGREVSRLLPDLGMPDGVFEVALEPLAEVGAHGAESVEFRVTVNRGFEPRPLARVASGGELSRVMLALKTILARVDRVPALVFDEIDAGIGGVVGSRIGEQLKEVSRHHQVFVITHLAQIAARADHHLRVTKTSGGARTTAEVQAVAGEERVRELARMLGGDPESGASLEHARELLSAAESPAAATDTGVRPRATARTTARGRRPSSSSGS